MQEVVIRPSKRWPGIRLRELWAYRELLYFLTWRDVKVRYKQTFFGAAWALIQPLALMVVFTALFGRFVPETEGIEDIPAPIFFYSGLVPWTLFSASLLGSAQSVVTGSNLVTKVYFPRLIMPIAATGSHLIDFAIAMVVLFGMMIAYGVAPTPRILWLPALTALALVTALGIGVGMSALNAKYRDVGYAVPFLTQLLLFISPVAYPASNVTDSSLAPLYFLNPMVAVIEGFRWCLLSTEPLPALTILSVATALILFLASVYYFRKLERSFADVI
jgi:lipopolysaccharide transport system permease protein